MNKFLKELVAGLQWSGSVLLHLHSQLVRWLKKSAKIRKKQFDESSAVAKVTAFFRKRRENRERKKRDESEEKF